MPDLRKALAELKHSRAEEITDALLAQGVDSLKVLEDGIVKGLNDVGARFQAKQAIVLGFLKGVILAKGAFAIYRLPAQEETAGDRSIIAATIEGRSQAGMNRCEV